MADGGKTGLRVGQAAWTQGVQMTLGASPAAILVPKSGLVRDWTERGAPNAASIALSVEVTHSVLFAEVLSREIGLMSVDG